MSSRNLEIALTKRAQRDLQAIRLYSLRTWGTEQADRYGDAIDRAFATIASHPEIAPIRSFAGRSLRAWPVEHHVIYYRVTSNRVQIVRILHERADPDRSLRSGNQGR